MTEFLISRFIRHKENVSDVNVRKKYGTLASVVGIICNLILFALKFVFGILSASIAITADSVNNLSDAGSSLITLLGFKLAARPADREHPYGHGRYEYLSGFVIAVLIMVIGVEFFRASVEKIFNPTPIEVNVVILCGMAASILLKLWMSFFYRKIGKKINSQAMAASAADSISDVVTTSVTLLGVLAGTFWDFPIDGYLGIFVAVMVFYAGFKVARDTLSPLLGRAPSPMLVEEIRNKALSYEGILDVHDIIVHDYGPGRILTSFHADVPANSDLVKIHELVDTIENCIFDELNIQAVIHIDPRDTLCKKTAELYDKVKKLVREYDESFGIHDFRVADETLIFDLTVPVEDKRKNEEIINCLSEKIEQKVKIVIDRT